MLNSLIHFPSKRKALITCLGITSLMIGCAAGDVPEATSDTLASTASEEAEATATEDSTAPAAAQPSQAPSEPVSDTSAEPSTAAADSSLVDLESGMIYADARALLIQKGWVPVEGPDPGPYGVERMAYDAGFTEVSGCAGTGAGQCRFDFFHPEAQKTLAVITYGGSKLEVGDWGIQDAASAQAPALANNSDADLVVETREAIPMQFQGEWDISLEGCGVPYSDGRLVIGLNRLEFYESSGAVLEVSVRGDREMTVTAEYSSEGEIFTATDPFRLSGDGSSLTDLDAGFVRYRCSD